MNPGFRCAGTAGMIAGLLLMVEAVLFLLSGWTPERFADPKLAIDLLVDGGGILRAAGLFGFAGLVATVYLLAGLGFALGDKSPARASGVLYLGLIGVAGHSLVPLSLWIGIPAFLDLASDDPLLAQAGWAGFVAVSDGAHGIGTLFLGCSMLLAGSAIVETRVLSRAVGWIGIAAGALTLTTLLGIGTPLQGATGMLFMPALTFTIVFRFAAGFALSRKFLPKEVENV